jgi:hypothetical protein
LRDTENTLPLNWLSLFPAINISVKKTSFSATWRCALSPCYRQICQYYCVHKIRVDSII